MALPLAGTWRLHQSSDAAGRSDSCTTAVEADPAIDLVYPADQSRYQSDVAELVGRATSRLGRTLALRWAVTRRPAGSVPKPPLHPPGRSPLARVRRARRLHRGAATARDDAGLTRS